MKIVLLQDKSTNLFGYVTSMLKHEIFFPGIVETFIKSIQILHKQ